MCGRYPSTKQAPLVAELELAMVEPAELEGVLALAPAMPAGLKDWWAPRWNVAPTQPVRAISARDGAPRLTLARWGLTIPSHGGKPKPPLINARSETVAEKPLLRKAMEKRRCLVLADGFYVWRGDGKARRPVRFAPAPGSPADDGRSITLAAIARGRQHEGKWLEEVSILTTAADELVAPVHDRRPVVIGAADRARWLDPGFPVDAVLELLAPCPLAGWTVVDAPPWLNSARVEKDAGDPAPPAQPSLF
jgi:putative SOS response-associated peptidase YedK